jgi:hypothetical protein
MELYPHFSDKTQLTQLALQNDIVSAYVLKDNAATKHVLRTRESAFAALQESIAEDALVPFVIDTLQTIAYNDAYIAIYIATRLLKDVPERQDVLYTFIQEVIAQLPEEDRQEAIFTVEAAMVSISPKGATLEEQELEDTQKFNKARECAVLKDFETAWMYQATIADKDIREECGIQIDSRIVRAVISTARKEKFVEARILCGLIQLEDYKVEASKHIDRYLYKAAIQACKDTIFTYARHLQSHIVDEDTAALCSNEIDYLIAQAAEKAAKKRNFPSAKNLLSEINNEDTRSRVEETINYYIDYYSN